MLIKGSSTIALVLTCVGLSTAAANADDFRHIDEIAVATRSDAARIANEIRYHFRGSRHYPHLYKDAYEMYTLADHIHDLAHTGDLPHIQADLAELDELYHHLEDLVGRVNAEMRYRHVHGGGFHLKRLNGLMGSMSENLHHLQDDVNSMLEPNVAPEDPVAPDESLEMPVPGEPVGPALVVPNTAHIDFGGGSSRVGVTFRVN